MSGNQRLVNFIKEYSTLKIKLPTPKSKLYKRDGKRTIFHTLEDAIREGKKWVECDTPFPTITLEQNGYYRFYGNGKSVYSHYDYCQNR